VTSENPFSPTFERSAFLETVGVGEVLHRLDAGLGAREPFLLLTAESGAGKTTLAHEAIARWDSRGWAIFLAHPPSTSMEILEEIVLRFGGEPADGASRPRLMACLERALTEIAGRGQTAMIVVDAAQRFSPESLDELHVLVTACTSPAFNVVLPLLGAIVTDKGGQLSHAAIVAREYGIPAVVGTLRATSTIPDGARIEVDGTQGRVRLL